MSSQQAQHQNVHLSASAKALCLCSFLPVRKSFDPSSQHQAEMGGKVGLLGMCPVAELVARDTPCGKQSFGAGACQPHFTFSLHELQWVGSCIKLSRCMHGPSAQHACLKSCICPNQETCCLAEAYLEPSLCHASQNQRSGHCLAPFA